MEGDCARGGRESCYVRRKRLELVKIRRVLKPPAVWGEKETGSTRTPSSRGKNERKRKNGVTNILKIRNTPWRTSA